MTWLPKNEAKPTHLCLVESRHMSPELDKEGITRDGLGPLSDRDLVAVSSPKDSGKEIRKKERQNCSGLWPQFRTESGICIDKGLQWVESDLRAYEVS